jgi:uncharacterized damage-inducible protein DinB
MTQTLEPILNEFREEAVITRRILERIPNDKLSWKPHQKSMTLGQLALHIANVPGRLANALRQEQLEIPASNFDPPVPKNVEEIHTAFEQSCKTAEDFLSSISEQAAQAPWRVMVGGRQAFSRPRIAVMRSIMMNHCYHHRGQLSVYLRMLDVPVPVNYGRSADENPFVEA